MANKTYLVLKDGETLKELKSLPAAKKLADTEGAEVFCDGACVYRGVNGSDNPDPGSRAEAESGAEQDTSNDSDTEQSTADDRSAATERTTGAEVHTTKTTQYRLTARMNIRKAPSTDASSLGVARQGIVVDVAAIENDWMRLKDGTFILYGGGKFAEKV